jgi:hypothetical protein
MSLITDKERLEKLEKWDMMMALMGFDHEERLADDWSSKSGEDFHERAAEYEDFMERLSNPNSVLTAILRGYEMGIRCQDMYDYRDHVEYLEIQKEQEERELSERNNPLIANLIEKRGYVTYTHQRYKKHHCADFMVKKTKVSLEIWGREYWGGDIQVRLRWTNKDGTKHLQKIRCNLWSFTIPKGFPDHWDVGNNPRNVKTAALVLAHAMTQGKNVLKNHFKPSVELPE